jgi:hypothetical protein
MHKIQMTELRSIVISQYFSSIIQIQWLIVTIRWPVNLLGVSITLTDIATRWTENRATWNKGAERVVKQIKKPRKSFLFLFLVLNFKLASYTLFYRRSKARNSDNPLTALSKK